MSPGGWCALPARTWAWPIRRALELAVAAYQACHFIGMPECSVHLTQAVIYLSLAPKSNALYVAYDERQKGRADAAGRAGAAGHPQRAHPADDSSWTTARAIMYAHDY